MSAKIIAVVNQKGGSGKTTISMQVAGTLARRGNEVLVVDADPQGTATHCAGAANDSKPFPAGVVSLSAVNTKVHREIVKFVNKYQYIIIDTPPAAGSQITQSALLIADLALVPIIPSPYDLWAAVEIKQAIENAMNVNEHLQARLVINQCQSATAIARDSIEVLPSFGIEVCQSQIKQRIAFRQAAAFGQTVHDLGKKAREAIIEIDNLTDEVLSILTNKMAKASSF